MGEHVDPYRHYLHYPHATAESAEASPDSLADYYDEEAADVEEELRRLFQAFRTEVYYGQRHYAPSPSWRDELTTKSSSSPVPPRFVVRVHLFERYAEQAGRYLGFVSLRPPKSTPVRHAGGMGATQSFRYVIDAELTTPKYMQRPRYHVLTTTAASARLGVVPFRSAVYSAPGLGKDRGSTCVHLAVSQALHLIMGRFSCRPISQIEFDWHLWLAAAAKSGQSESAPRETMTIGEMGQRGANLREALEVVRTSCNGGGFRMTVEPRDDPDSGRLSAYERGMAARFITDALACGLPIVAIVRTANLLPPNVRAQLSGERCNAPHAVLILGMHLLHSEEEIQYTPTVGWDQREDRAELPGRLIVHDTLTRGPYFECVVSDFLDAAEAAFPLNFQAEEEESRGVHMLALGPKGLELSNNQARDYGVQNLRMMLDMMGAQEQPAEANLAALAAYLQVSGIERSEASNPGKWRLICRFLSTPELRSRYDDMEQSHRDFGPLPTSYFWVIEIRHPHARRQRSPEGVAGPAEMPPAMVFVWDCTQASESKLDGQMQHVHAPGAQMIFRFKLNPEHCHARSS